MKKAMIMIICILLFFSIFIVFLPTGICPGTVDVSSGKTLYVGGSLPENYTKIQDAVDNASDGDTVFVYNGTYYENVVVYKTVNLIGENKETTIIDGNGSESVVFINADNVTINGFSIINSGNSTYDAGVTIYSNHNNISEINIQNNRWGIYLFDCSDNDIFLNSIFNNSYSGILSEHTSNNTVTQNFIWNNPNGGITVFSGSHDFFSFNHIQNGISFWEDSNNSTLSLNYIYDSSYYGIQIESGSNITINSNQIFNNSFGGIQIGSFSESNNISSNTIYENNYDGIYITHSSNNSIFSNNVHDNSNSGIGLGGASKNIVILNDIYNNYKNGIYLLIESDNNTITGNTISNNSYYGILIQAIGQRKPSNNIVYNNNFNNSNNSMDNGNMNIWNISKIIGVNIMNGPYIGGNYWSDYNGTDNDSDGIGDNPYNILGGNSQDTYPLMKIDGKRVESTTTKTPGFELILVVCAIALVLLWKRKRIN